MYKIIETNEATATRYIKELNLSPLTAKFLANRLPDFEDGKKLLNANYEDEVDVSLLKNGFEAAELLLTHMDAGDKIASINDLDCDGASSAGIFILSMDEVFKYENYVCWTNERSYPRGVNDNDIVRIDYELDIKLVITADQGSSEMDNETYAKIRERDISIIATDHHEVTNGVPSNANVFVNNQQDGCKFSPYVCGAAILYYTLVCLHILKTRRGEELPSMDFMLGIVGAATVVDAMDMSKPINRAIVNKGIDEFNKNEHRLYQGITDALNKKTPYTEDDFGINIGSVFNASGRMNKSKDVVELYRQKSVGNISNYFKKVLMQNNQERKKFQADVMSDVKPQLKGHSRMLKHSMVLVTERRGAGGVNGVIAGMVGNQLNRPTIVFGIDKDNRFKGSSRAMLPGLNFLDMIHSIQRDNKDMVKYAAGHQGAFGIEVYPDSLYPFMRKLDTAVGDFTNGILPKVNVDLELDSSMITLKTVDDVNAIAPYGNYYKRPLLVTTLTCIKAFAVGVGKIHAVLEFKSEHGEIIKGFSINGNDGKLHSYIGKEVVVIYTIGKEIFKGELIARILVEHMNLKE